MKQTDQPTIGLVTWPSISYYLTVGAAFCCFKLIHRLAETHQLRFLLQPVSWLVDMVSGTHSVYIQNEGYFNHTYNILINKSCSGFNFWILCFAMLAVLLARFVPTTVHRFALLPAILAVAYLLTLWVNASRILFSLFINNHLSHHLGVKLVWLHQAEGTFVYLSFLVLIYLGMEYLLNRLICKHAKFS